MVDVIIRYLYKYLFYVTVGYYTFIFPLLMTESINYNSDKFDSLAWQTYISNLNHFVWEPVFKFLAGILVGVVFYNFLKNRPKYQRQLVKSVILALILILGVSIP
jgi:hypothetical protein